ncbi:MAG: hypothetical protein ACKVQV_01855 [Bacteroidia bacterium]
MRQKLAILILGVLFIAVTSCKTKERCPAYGQHIKAQEQRPS